MKLKVYDNQGSVAGDIAVPDGLLDVTPRRDVLHAVVVWQEYNRRAFTAATKGYRDLSGGGRKPWRQKGTGRARQGTIRAVQWRHGAIAHGPRPKHWQEEYIGHLLPKKVRRLGLRMALADRAQGDALMVVRGLLADRPSTKAAVTLLKALGGKKTLVVVGDGRAVKGTPSAQEKSFRNLENVRVLQAEGLNVRDILAADRVLVAEDALAKVIARLRGKAEA